MAHDVFISYSHLDKPVADAACATLESRGVRCWIAPRDVLPGDEYASALVNAIHSSRMLVLVFSSGANQSPQVLREVERAVSKGLPILPLRIEDVTPSAAMEYYISSRHWLDALTTPVEQHLIHLADTVTMLLSRTPGGPTPHAPEPVVQPVPAPPPVKRADAPATSNAASATVAGPSIADRTPPDTAERSAAGVRKGDPDRERRGNVAIAAIGMLAVLGLAAGWEQGGARMFGWDTQRISILAFCRLVTLGIGFAAGGILMRSRPVPSLARAAGLAFGIGVLLTGFIGPAGGSFAWFLLSYSILTGFGAGLGFIVIVTTLLRWFPDRRGLLAGVATAGFGIAGIVGGTLLQALGFRALIALGIGAVAALTLAARAVTSPVAGFKPSGWTPSAVQQRRRTRGQFGLRAALASWQWSALGGVLFLNTFLGICAVLNLVSGGVASPALLTAVLWGLGAGGSLVWAWLSDAVGPRQVLVALLAVQALLLFFFRSQSESDALLMMVVAFFNGGVFGVIPVLAADYFGTDDLGATYGAMLGAWCLAFILMPAAPGILGAMGAYRTQRFTVIGVLMVATAVIAVLLRPPGAGTLTPQSSGSEREIRHA